MIAHRLQLLTLALLATGCGPNAPAGADLAAPLDLAVPPTGVTLTVDGVAHPLDAYYSIFIEPLEIPGVPAGIELVVTFVDPAFQCASPTSTLDRISFGFQARLAGVTSSFVVGRSGPHLGAPATGTGYAELTLVDDRYVDWDGGLVFVTPGGMVRGDVHYQLGTIAIDGPFVASHCAALDAIASP